MRRFLHVLAPLSVLILVLVACSSEPLATVAMDGAVEPLLAAAEAGQPLPDRYIVVFRDGVSRGPALAAQLVRAAGGELHHVYEHALNGFAATLPAQAASALQRNPNVAYVEQDMVATLHDTTWQGGATWGLDRIDQRLLPLDGQYTYAHTGKDVTAYVIDSGINMSHQDFGGRARFGFDAFPGDDVEGGDCNGHGTHVAGTIGGATRGVAKNVSLVSVRVFTCSGGTAMSTVIAGVDWVTSEGTRPGVVNMSLGGGYAQSLNDAVSASVKAGFVYTVSAGNDGRDACSFSPASTLAALTVGATQSNDDRARYSNVGDCVDIFAPGSSITSAWIGSDTAERTISGTSMSAPHVAGVAALLLEQDVNASPGAVFAAITSGATKGVVSRARSANNDMLFSLVTFGGQDAPVDPGDPEDPSDPGDPGDPTDPIDDSGLSGSATRNGPSWTATVTLTGKAEDSTGGTWSNGDAGGCTIESGKSACSFSLSGLANRDDTISYTDEDRGTVTITR